jgi:hypothetical protein
VSFSFRHGLPLQLLKAYYVIKHAQECIGQQGFGWMAKEKWSSLSSDQSSGSETIKYDETF